MQTKPEDFQLKIIEVQIKQLMSMFENFISNDTTTSDDLSEWVNLEQAASKKGGAALNTFKTRYWLQPCAGTNSKRVGGRKCWAKSDVLVWLKITDEQLPEYAEKFGVKIPS